MKTTITLILMAIIFTALESVNAKNINKTSSHAFSNSKKHRMANLINSIAKESHYGSIQLPKTWVTIKHFVDEGRVLLKDGERGSITFAPKQSYYYYSNCMMMARAYFAKNEVTEFKSWNMFKKTPSEGSSVLFVDKASKTALFILAVKHKTKITVFSVCYPTEEEVYEGIKVMKNLFALYLNLNR